MGAAPFGDKMFVTTSVGDTDGGGQPCCCSPHESVPGCWRMSLSIAKSPFGDQCDVANYFARFGELLASSRCSDREDAKKWPRDLQQGA